MILQNLTLLNFGLYRGEHVFDLTPSAKRQRPAPIILFGGINGGGKTTILDAIQLVLYGNRARCSKRADKPYDEFLRQSIHHGIPLTEGASIELAFRFAAEGEEHVYAIKRLWSGTRDKVSERIEVLKDGVSDGWLAENWNQVVEELIPFGIAQLCFFDAEKIRFLAEDETSSQALLKGRTLRDGSDPTPENLAKHFRLHLHRGIGYLATPNRICSIGELLRASSVLVYNLAQDVC